MADFLPISQPRKKEIQRETENDRTMQILKCTVLKDGQAQSQRSLQKFYPIIDQIRDELTVQNRIIFRGERCVVHSEQTSWQESTDHT